MVTMLTRVPQAFEATQIENSALRAAIRTASLSSGISVLTPDGTLVVNASSSRVEGPNEAEDIEAACGILERQARELAKQNRAKRDT